MPRVLRIQSRLCVGGPALHTTLLARELSYLAGSKYDTTLVTGAVEPGEKSLAASARQAGLSVYEIRNMRRSVHPWRDARAALELGRLMRREQPDVVHTHTSKAGALGRMTAAALRAPVIVHTFHGHVFGGYFSGSAEKAFIQAERALSRVADRILVISQSQREDIVERFAIAPAHKVQVVPLGLDLSRFRPGPTRGTFRQELGFSDEPLVVSIGRLAPIKRIDRLLRCFERLQRRRPDAHLAIVGDGESRSELEAQVENPNVHFLGYRTDAPQVLADADVLALTSDNEGTPVAVIESVVSGTPVVATRVGGVPEVLGEAGGRLVDPSDEEGFTEALHGLLDKRYRLPDAERLRVAERFSKERLVADVTSLYDELLESKRGSSPFWAWGATGGRA